MASLSIIIPAYNEEESLKIFLPEVIDFCKQKNYNLIIVNDASKDNSKVILDENASGNDFLKVIHHKVNKGYGGAIKTGIQAAQTKYVITIDADGQHLLSDVERMHQAVVETDADMIVGKRSNSGKSSLFRRMGKSIIRFVASRLMTLEIKDINSGIKIYNTELAKKYVNICPDSMAFSDIILLVFVYQKNLVKEIPVSIHPRVAGKSTISIATAFDTLKEIMNIVMMFNPMRIFFPISLLFFVAGLLWGVQFIVQGKGLSIASGILLLMSLFIFLLALIAEQLSTIKDNAINN